MKKQIITACLLILIPTAGIAGSFTMNPGKWEFTTSMTMPMFPAPQVTTDTECITKEDAERDPIDDLLSDGNCRVINKKQTKSSMTFEMECTNEGVISRGKGQFSSKGNSASGSMDLTMEIPNMPAMPNMPAGPMTMKTTWQGKRIGACD